MNDNCKLGYDPRTPPDIQTKGPICQIRHEGFETANVHSEKTYIDYLNVICEFVWHIDNYSTANWMNEINHLGNICQEFVNPGICLDETYAGEIYQITAENFLDNGNSRNERLFQIRLSVRGGAPYA